jgi:hypothetical protein
MAGMSKLFPVALILGVSFVSPAHVPTISERTARKLVREALVALGENGPFGSDRIAEVLLGTGVSHFLGMATGPRG